MPVIIRIQIPGFMHGTCYILTTPRKLLAILSHPANMVRFSYLKYATHIITISKTTFSKVSANKEEYVKN